MKIRRKNYFPFPVATKVSKKERKDERIDFVPLFAPKTCARETCLSKKKIPEKDVRKHQSSYRTIHCGILRRATESPLVARKENKM